MDSRLILVTLLIRLGVAAAISSVLVRARRFRVLLFREERTLGEKIEMVFIVSTPLALGRAGALVGPQLLRRRHRLRRRDPDGRHRRPARRTARRCAGVAAGAVRGRVAVPPAEYSRRRSWPACCAISRRSAKPSGRSRRCSISASTSWMRRTIRRSFIDWQTSFFVLILGLEFLRIQLHRTCPRRIFALDSSQLGRDTRHLRRNGHGGRHCSQGAEQRSHRDEAGAAGAAAACRRAWRRCRARSIRTSCSTRSTPWRRWCAATPTRRAR